MIVEKQLYSKDYAILELMVEDYWNAYHPADYDTRLVRPVYYDHDRNVWCADITRLSSCD